MQIGIDIVLPICDLLLRLTLCHTIVLRHATVNGNTLPTSPPPSTTTTAMSIPRTSSASESTVRRTLVHASSSSSSPASPSPDYLVLPLIHPTLDPIININNYRSAKPTADYDTKQTELTNRIDIGGGVGGKKVQRLDNGQTVGLPGEISNTNDNMLEEFYRTPMSFGTENLTMITTQVGATAYLPCLIHFIGESVVSWIRRKDYHLLTVALTTYSSDERFSAKHLKTSEDWTLQIKYVQPRDAGSYECQVSSHPPTSIFVHLNVIEARAEIIGPPIRYLTPDSTLRLICRVVQSTETAAFLFWYHDDRMINYDTDRGINITTEADYHYSELTILRATKKHSGNYSCVPSNSQPASVLIHIFKGDNPAAMHHDHVNSAVKMFAGGTVLLNSFLFIFLLFLQLLSVFDS